MYKAMEVAKYIINYSNEINTPVSNLKLQKLLYYIQAAMLVEEREKCFSDPIVAWEFGPVVVSVYQAYREYGRGNIPNQGISKEMQFDPKTMRIIYVDSKEITGKYKQIIEKVINAYKQVDNPFFLVKKTHQELPWKNTELNEEIDCGMIRDYYSENVDELYS